MALMASKRVYSVERSSHKVLCFFLDGLNIEFQKMLPLFSGNHGLVGNERSYWVHVFENCSREWFSKTQKTYFWCSLKTLLLLEFSVFYVLCVFSKQKTIRNQT